MKRRLNLIAAPPSIQPGEYVPAAYAGATRARTPWCNFSLERSAPGWTVTLGWPCPKPVRSIAGDTGLFADAAALLVPAAPDAPMMSMGASGLPVEGFLWRADWKAPVKIRAEGFGTVQRLPAPAGWTALGDWQDGTWLLRFSLPSWPALEQRKLIGVAVWQGAHAERAGLKSVTADWIGVTA